MVRFRGTLRVVFVVGVALVSLALTSTSGAATNPYRLRYYDHSGTACASLSTTAGTSDYYKTPNSVTGMAFDGTNLLFSCWADNTITAVRPSASQTIFPKDSSVGTNGVYTVTGLTGIGGIDWDSEHSVLWVCNLSAFTGTNRKLGSDIGYVRFNSSGVGTFTHFATAPDGCVNGIDYNPINDQLSASGAKVSASTQTVDRYIVNANLTAGALTKFLPGQLTPDGYVSGTLAMTGSLYLADNHGTTKTLQYTTDMVHSGLVSSTTARRYEDLACDPVTFAPKTVVWVEWFDHNETIPFETSDSCAGNSPPPPSLQISQTASSGVVADSPLAYQVQVKNPGTSSQTNVNLSDTVPANTIFQSASASQGTCSGTTTITCALGSLAGGASATVTLTITPIQPGTVTNTATAVSDQASQVTSNQDANVSADPAVTYTTVNDAGLNPTSTTLPLGSTAQYNIFGTLTHDLTETTVQLFDSGALTPVSYYREEFDAAGAYTVSDSATGTTQAVKLRPNGPANGAVGASFTVTWATANIPVGFDEDVQVQLPGTTTWTNWMMNQTTTAGDYTASAAGTYKFRARFQRTGGSATLYSPVLAVTVS
jgi:uncharacterized repeat protein (TIGR01451 family)